MKLRPHSVVTVLIALVLLTGTRSVRADIRDNAGFFSEDALRQGNFDLRDIKQRHGKELFIETHATIPADLQPQLKQLGENKFYAQWTARRATDAKVDGAAVLITKDPPYLHVMVGDRANQSGAFTTADGAKLREQLRTSFKEKQYDQGLLSAVRTFRETLTSNLGASGAAPAPVERAPSAVAPAPRSTNEPQANPGAFEPRGRNVPDRGGSGGGGFSFWKLVIWGIIILILVRVISRLFTRRHAQHQHQQHPGGGLFGRRGGGFGRGRYGQGGYDPRYGGGGGLGGFGTGLGGGLLGGLLGGWLGGRMMGGGSGSTAHGAPPPTNAGTEPGVFSSEHDSHLASSGGSFHDAGGGDFGGGDFGGGDAGGGDF